MECRRGCGACCEVASINSPIPGMAQGKPAGVACINLDLISRDCLIWGRSDYPEFCAAFRAVDWVCGESREAAETTLRWLEQETKP